MFLRNVENNDEWFSPEIETCLGDVAGASVVLSFLAEKSRAMATKKIILSTWYHKLLPTAKEWHICLDRFDHNLFNQINAMKTY